MRVHFAPIADVGPDRISRIADLLLRTLIGAEGMTWRFLKEASQ